MTGPTFTQNNEAKKVPEVPKPEAAAEQPTFEQDSAILTSSDVKAEQEETKTE